MQTEMFDLLHETVWSNPIVLSKFLTAISGNNITLQQSMTI
jgi:formate-dependent nitrite reductase membrane component NrfD